MELVRNLSCRLLSMGTWVNAAGTQMLSWLQGKLRLWFTRRNTRLLCGALFFFPLVLYFYRQWSELSERPLALDLGVVTVAAALGGLVLNAGLNLRGSKRKETVEVAQKFIAVVILFIIFLPSIHFVELMDGISLVSFEPSSVEAWFRGFFFWVAVISFYGGIPLFIIALVDLVFAMIGIHCMEYASAGIVGADMENNPSETGTKFDIQNLVNEDNSTGNDNQQESSC